MKEQKDSSWIEEARKNAYVYLFWKLGIKISRKPIKWRDIEER